MKIPGDNEDIDTLRLFLFISSNIGGTKLLKKFNFSKRAALGKASRSKPIVSLTFHNKAIELIRIFRILRM